MNHEQIEELIDRINSNDHHDHIFLFPLTDSIKTAKVWPRPIEDEILPVHSGYRFYFIYEPDEICIAAVLDAGDRDLHLFVKEAHRRKGIMRTALSNVILPHLRSTGRETQSVTYRTKEVQILFKSLGFTEKDSETSTISLKSFPEFISQKTASNALTKDRMLAIQKRIWMASGLVRMVLEEVTESFDEGTIDRLDHTAEALNGLGHAVEGAWRNMREK